MLPSLNKKNVAQEKHPAGSSGSVDSCGKPPHASIREAETADAEEEFASSSKLLERCLANTSLTGACSGGTASCNASLQAGGLPVFGMS